MIEFIFILILILAFIFYVLNYKTRQNEQFENDRHKWENPIKIQLQEKGFELVDIKMPDSKEVLKSYSFAYFQLSIFKNPPFQPFDKPVDFKIIFKNQNGVLCENWLQISENAFNGNISFDWQPNLEIFSNTKEELRY